MNSGLGVFLVSMLIVSGIGSAIELQSKQYAWSYAIIILLGVMIAYNSQVSQFLNFALTDKR